jgi:hypothetical protein
MCHRLIAIFTRAFLLSLEVKTCSKALLAMCRGHGKSPCFLKVAFLHLISPDWLVSKFCRINGATFLECAF